MPDLQSRGCGFESWPGLLRIKVYSAFHPSGVSKWVPAAAGKAKAGMAHSDCGWTCGCAGKTEIPWACAIPERFWGGDSLRRGAISSVCTFTFTFTFYIITISSKFGSAGNIDSMSISSNWRCFFGTLARTLKLCNGLTGLILYKCKRFLDVFYIRSRLINRHGETS